MKTVTCIINSDILCCINICSWGTGVILFEFLIFQVKQTPSWLSTLTIFIHLCFVIERFCLHEFSTPTPMIAPDKSLVQNRWYYFLSLPHLSLINLFQNLGFDFLPCLLLSFTSSFCRPSYDFHSVTGTLFCL